MSNNISQESRVITDPYVLLQWQRAMGADECIGVEVSDRFARPEPSRDPILSGAAQNTASAPGTAAPPGKTPAPVLPEAPAIQTHGGLTLADRPEEARLSAQELARDAQDLETLRRSVDRFDGCGLKKSATTTVFGTGNPQARLVCVGEAPGAEEDRQGEPFVGRSGLLLNKMLSAIGLERDEIYITNILPWRPPGNRSPTAAEVAVCEPFIRRHLQLIGPEIVLCLGGASAKTLLSETRGINRLRGQWFDLTLDAGGQESPLTVQAAAIFHPAYLLRTPDQKRMAWRDLLMVKSKLKEFGTDSLSV